MIESTIIVTEEGKCIYIVSLIKTDSGITRNQTVQRKHKSICYVSGTGESLRIDTDVSLRNTRAQSAKQTNKQKIRAVLRFPFPA